MTADEMFENLGFIKNTYKDEITYSRHRQGDFIIFDLKNQKMRTPKCFRSNPEKQKAIDQFKIEQGWNV